MRNIPGLSGDLFARSSKLSEKARASREAAPGAVPPSASIAPAKVSNGVATLRIYDYIDPDGGYWGISANEFADALDAIEEDVTQIELLINSGGGSVWDGLAILNTLRSHPATVTARVDGVAASAASFIAVACDEVVMMPNSRLMIHDALGLCIGQAVDMREYADFLDDTSGNIAEIYATKTGGTVDEWRTLMTANGLMGKWYSAQDALDVGLADRIGASAAVEDRGAAAPEAATDAAMVPTSPAATAEHDERFARFQQTRHEFNRQRAGA
jgi:ATP-dependent protease ClpP protease subunit